MALDVSVPRLVKVRTNSLRGMRSWFLLCLERNWRTSVVLQRGEFGHALSNQTNTIQGQNRTECGVPPPPSTTTTPTPIPGATTVTVTTTATPTDVEDGPPTQTVTEPTDCPNSCPSVETVTETETSVVTSVETVTVFTSVPPDVSIITVYSTVSVTVSVGNDDPGCNPTSKPHHWPTKPGHPSKPGHHGSTSYPPGYSEPIRHISQSANETTSGPTSTPALVTGGAGTLQAGKLGMVVVVAFMFLL